THSFAATSGPDEGSARPVVSARSRTNLELASLRRAASVTGALLSKDESDSVQAAWRTPLGLSPARTGPIGKSPTPESSPNPVQLRPCGNHSSVPRTPR